MKKIYLRTMVAVLLLLCSTVASAHDFEVGGIYYNIISSSDLTVEVTYKGNNYSSYDDEYSSAVVIPQTVTYNSKTYSVTTIGNYAFRYCTGLTSVTIPNSVTSIGSGAFYKCSGLKSITVEGGNAVYDSRENCNAIIETQTNTLIAGCKNTIIPNSVTTIGDYAFECCYGLTSITIPNGVTTIGNYAFYDCTGLTSITIPNSVTNIGSWAFACCTGLTSITIPNSVTTIGNDAFSNCTDLTSIIVEEGNAIYDSRENCNAIIETQTNTLIRGCINTIIPGSVTTIGELAFWGCTDLTSITIGNSVTTIAGSAFSGCRGLTSVTIGNSVTTIGSCAFYGCTGLTSVTIPNSVTTIGDEAFHYTAWYNNQPDGLVYAGKVLYKYKGTMPQNTSIAIKDGTLGIAECAFRDCTGLTSVTIPNSVTTIGYEAFRGCTGLTTITIPNSVTAIGNYAFRGCTDLTSVTIPNSVTTIEHGAFEDCSGLTSVEIPSSVTNIGSWAFAWCTGLTSITIHNSVTTIGYWAFYKCTNLTDVYCHATTVPETRSDAFDNSNATNATLHVPATAIESYRTTAPWSNFGTIVAIEGSEENKNLLDLGACGDNLTCAIDTVENKLYINGTGDMYDFDYNNHAPWYNYRIEITSVSINDGVTTIGAHAFDYCIGLTSVTIPNSVTSIGDNAFLNCKGLTSIIVEEGNAVYDSRENCNAIIETQTNTLIRGCKSTTIPGSITTIEGYAFSNCTGLTSITIPSSVTSIGVQAFSGCYGLTSIVVDKDNSIYDSRDNCNAIIETQTNTLIIGRKSTIIPNSVTTIGDHAFSNCTGLTTITIPNSVTAIGNYAFRGCTDLTSVTIPNSVTTIEHGAFEDCSGLTSVEIPSSVTNIGSWAFAWCTGLTSITIHNSVTTIGDHAFYDCTRLTSVTIPNSVTTIGSSAFCGCTGLTSVTIPNSVTTIGYEAFRGCTGLTSVTIPNSVTTIEGYAFGSCTGLTSIEIPNSVTTIENDAFENCTGLTSVTIPNSVTSIGDFAFRGCTGLTDVYCHATTVPETSSNAFNNSNATNATLHVPATAIESYRATAPWSDFGTIVAIEGSEENKNLLDLGACGDNLTCAIDTVENKLYINGTGDMYDFDYNNHAPWYNYRREITSVSINDRVTTIGAYAFDDCTGLKNIEMPNSLKTINHWAFNYCSNLTSVTIPNSITLIGHGAFYGCSGLASVTIPNGATSIGVQAFGLCSSLTSIEIPNSVTNIGVGAFHNCKGLTSIIVEEGNAVYDSRDNCNAIIETQTNTLITGCKSTIIPGNVTNIGEWAFDGCSGLKSIEIPGSVTSIKLGAFRGCSDLTSITVDSGNTVYDSRDNCNAIIETQTNTLITGCKSTIIPGNVTNIGEWAFRELTNLTSITIPNSVTSIGELVFYNCTNLTDVYCLATTVPSTSSDAFDYPNCKTATLHVPATAIESYRATAPWSDFGTIVAIEGSEEDSDEPSITTGEAIDLGLPSGIKWASCNIGATAPEEYGTYFQWDGTDIAQTTLGGNWYMPTKEEGQELIDNCTWTWATRNDINGYIVTGPNGNSIFLPATGWSDNSVGIEGNYWTITPSDIIEGDAYDIQFDINGRIFMDYGAIPSGYQVVRPVYDDGSSTSIEIITPEVNNENTIYDLRGQKLTEITAPGIYIVNGKKVIVK